MTSHPEKAARVNGILCSFGGGDGSVETVGSFPDPGISVQNYRPAVNAQVSPSRDGMPLAQDQRVLTMLIRLLRIQ